MAFPRSRFQQAGATPSELDQLEAEHQALPDNMAGWNEEHWAGQDVEGLRAALEVRRGHGIDANPAPDVEREQDDEKAFEDMTVKELRAHADAYGVEISHGATKAEIVAALEAFTTPADFEPDDDVDDLEPDDVED